MRVLVITDEYDYSHFTFIYNEIKKLETAGVELFVICERVGKLKDTDTNYACIPMTRNRLLNNFFLWANNKKFFAAFSWYPYFKKRKQIIQKFRPDLIHVHFGDTAVRFYYPLKQTFRRYPFVVSFHGFDASSLLHKELYLERLRTMFGQHGVYGICVSDHLRNNLLAKSVRIGPDNSFLLYYGTDAGQFSRSQRQNNAERIFLQVSTFVEKKGHIYTLQAFRKFIARNPGKARLILGGDGAMRNEIMQEARQMGLSGVVEFPGWISREGAAGLLNKADYFVHHSVTAKDNDQEGMPNAIIEAMAMELPVLATYHSGIPELVENGVNGLLVQEKDVEEYAKQMEEMLSWTYLPANRERVLRQFSLEAHTNALLRIYKKITGDFPAAR